MYFAHALLMHFSPPLKHTQVCGLTALAIPCLLAAFLFKEQWVFYLGMVLGEFLLFSTTSPVNGVFLWCVPPSQRSMSVACMNILIHLLGDVFSPALAGERETE